MPDHSRAAAQTRVTSAPAAAYRANVAPQRLLALPGSAAKPKRRKGTPGYRSRSSILSLAGGAGAGEQTVVGVLKLRIAQEDQVGELLGQGPRRPDEPHAGLAQQP